MKIQYSAIIFLSCISFLSGQQPAAGSAANSQLEGNVINALTGEPLKKAQVALRTVIGTSEAASVATDTAGHFVISGASPGKYYLYAERNGYLRGEYGSRAPEKPGTTLAIASGQRIDGLVLRLFPQGVISGRVRDEDGEPLANVDVQALQVNYLRGRRQMVPVWIGTTNDLGEFRAYGLNPGRYFIGATYRPEKHSAVQHSLKSGESGPELTYAATYFPGTNQATGASPIDLAAGGQIPGIELVMLRKPSVHIHGRVTNPVANGSGRTSVVLTPRDGTLGFLNSKSAAIKDMKGTFELEGVTVGSYLLSATWTDGTRRYSARRGVDVGSVNIDDVDLVINTGSDLRGHVRIEGAPANLGDAQICLEPRESSASALRAKLKSGGAFVLQNVAPETYNLSVTGAPEEYYIKSARIGEQDVLEKGVNLEQGGINGELEVLLSPRGGQIDGVVSNDSQGPSFAMIVLVPDAPRRGETYLYKTTTTDQYGHFTLRGISPGDYRVFAWGDVESGACQDSEFLGRFEAKGEHVSIEEGAHRSLQLRLIPAE